MRRGTDKNDDIISVGEARKILRVSPSRMAELIASCALAAEPNPLDRRGKLLKRSEVEALARRAGRKGV